MSSVIVRPGKPLTLGKEDNIIDESFSAAGTKKVMFSVDSESVSLSLYVRSVSGTLDVRAYTEGQDGHLSEDIITFPTISAPTTNLILRKAALTLQRVVVEAVFSDACDFSIRARGASAEAASFRIESAGRLRTSQIDVTTTAIPLVPTSLTDRTGVLVMNNNVDTDEILYVGGIVGEATVTEGYPVYPGGNITVNIDAGATVFGRSDTGTVDVRIAETGA